jgi:uncharacterized protein YciI
MADDGSGGSAYLFYCRDRPGSLALRDEHVEAHWAFMDAYAEGMIARGPTYSPGGETVTGSMHIVELPDAAAARVFAYDEPNYRAGVYGEVLVRRWRNCLGRTMWDFTGAIDGYQRFLIIAHGRPEPAVPLDAQRHYFEEHHDRLIAWGPLLTEDTAEWTGTAILAELPDRGAAEALMAHDPAGRRYTEVEIHRWRFGGRPDEAERRRRAAGGGRSPA